MHRERHVPHLSEPNSSAHLFISISMRGAGSTVRALGCSSSVLRQTRISPGGLYYSISPLHLLKTRTGGLQRKNKQKWHSFLLSSEPLTAICSQSSINPPLGFNFQPLWWLINIKARNCKQIWICFHSMTDVEGFRYVCWLCFTWNMAALILWLLVCWNS